MALRLLARQHLLLTQATRCYAAGADFLKDVPLKNRDGNVSVDDLKNKKWYESAAKKEGIEIVWISRDKEADHLLDYYEKALPNVPYVPFGDKHIKQFLEKYSVKTIPQARLVNSKGEVVEAEARNRIQEEGKVEAQKLARTFVDMV